MTHDVCKWSNLSKYSNITRFCISNEWGLFDIEKQLTSVEKPERKLEIKKGIKARLKSKNSIFNAKQLVNAKIQRFWKIISNLKYRFSVDNSTKDMFLLPATLRINLQG